MVQVVPTRRVATRFCGGRRCVIEIIFGFAKWWFFPWRKNDTKRSRSKKMESRNAWGCHGMTSWHFSVWAHDSLALFSRRPQLYVRWRWQPWSSSEPTSFTHGCHVSYGCQRCLYFMNPKHPHSSCGRQSQSGVSWDKLPQCHSSRMFQMGNSITAIWSHVFGCTSCGPHILTSSEVGWTHQGYLIFFLTHGWRCVSYAAARCHVGGVFANAVHRTMELNSRCRALEWHDWHGMAVELLMHLCCRTTTSWERRWGPVPSAQSSWATARRRRIPLLQLVQDFDSWHM